MQGAWNIAVGIAVLGIGFGVGRLSPPHAVSDRDGNPAAPSEAITFQGKPGPGKTANGPLGPGFGPLPFSTYAEAKGRLAELLAAYHRLSHYRLHLTDGERILEEIEGILALADTAELAAFIHATESTWKTNPLVEIAFAALARISPEQAAQTGLERWPQDGTKEFSGLSALMREWEKRAPAAAERWIAGIENEALRSMARTSFLTMKTGSDPATTLRSLGEIDPKMGDGFASVLGASLDPARMPEAAARFLEPREDGTTAVEMLSSFLTAWGRREPDAMMAWLLSQDLEAIGSEPVRQSLQGLAAADPGGFLEKITPDLAEKPMLREVASQAWWSWLTKEGGETEAIRWLGEHPDLASQFTQSRMAYMWHGQWTAERAERSLAALASLPESESKTAFSQPFLGHLAQSHPKAVLGYAMEHLPLGSQTDMTIASAVGSWASTEPEAAVRWSLENLESPNGRNDAVRFAISRWGEKDPLAAAEMVLSLPEKERGSAFWGLAFEWAEKDPQGVLSFLKGASDPAAVSSLTQNSFRHFSEKHRGAQYVQEALAMPPGKMRRDAVNGLFGGWALSDKTAGVEAMEQIPEGTLRDAAIQGFNGFAIRSDPKLAIELATRISVPAARDKELVNRGRSWMRQDRTTAEAAIRANSAIPESVKTEIFK